MAQRVLSQETHEERTEGKSWGPVSSAVTYTGMVATVLVFVAGLFGLVIPAEVAVAFATLVMAGVAWLAKGRKVIETVCVVTDGTGKHRAETE